MEVNTVRWSLVWVLGVQLTCIDVKVYGSSLTLIFPLQVLFVQIDTSEDASDRVSEFFGIEDDDVPTCRIINLQEDMKKFVPEFKGLDPDDIKTFVNDYLDDKLKVTL